jgi:DNA polymerase
MVVGEAPGEVEWRLKRPFVGPTGTGILRPALLDVGINPADVYITNVVKIWPRNKSGKTRRPHSSEIKLALPYLQDEIRAIAPRCVLALGNVANKTLTDCIDGINTAQGQWRPLASIFGVQARVLATFHPADVPGRRRKPEPRWRADLAEFARGCRL